MFKFILFEIVKNNQKIPEFRTINLADINQLL